MMERCENCPIAIWLPDKGKPYYTIPGEWGCKRDKEECCVTLANQRIMDAMIAGEWRCDTCVEEWTRCASAGKRFACGAWQPREGDGE